APGDFAGGNRPADTTILARNKLGLLYCGGGDCDASKLVGVRLAGIGFRNIVIYKDGFKGWTAAGLPVTGSAGGGK
ncbi:MAG: rhodanese-like domain-containing protein, partial [bacterium]